ncbi:MAG: LysM domain-containing protein [Syntrophotaleaceae bacterium]
MTFIKKGLLLCCLLLLPASAGAAENPRIYTIQKGDTLWGISQKFIEDPYYWPNLWSHNPFVRNPHFIYPGQRVAIYEGKLVFLPAEGEAALPSEVGEEPAALPLPEPEEQIIIKTTAAAEGFVTADELASSGTLVDATDARLLMAENDLVFIEMRAPMQPGDYYSLVEVGDQVRHPISGKNIGNKITYLGQVLIREIKPPVATADIVHSEKEIMRGARLIPSLAVQQSVALKKAAASLSGYVIAGSDEKIALSQHDTINVDLGSRAGLAEGNLLYISRPKKASASAMNEHKLPLPDSLMGAAVVVNVKPDTASALILKSVGPIYTGDRVVTATE